MVLHNIAKEKGFIVDNQGDLGLSMRTNDLSVSFMKKGSAVVVGPKDESDAISLYKSLFGKRDQSMKLGCKNFIKFKKYYKKYTINSMQYYNNMKFYI